MIKVHIKIDTGMHRLGFDANEEKTVAKAFQMKHLQIDGIYSHLCVADSLKKEDVEFTLRQIDAFYRLIRKLKERGLSIPKTHIQSSYGFLNYPTLQCDYVRTGVALYGVLSSAKDIPALRLLLQPVLALKARVVLIRDVKKGESVGYGRTYVAEKDSRIAILSVGYADGYPRNLSGGRAKVLYMEKQLPL